MASIPGKLRLIRKVDVQTRRAQAVDRQLARAIRSACQSNRCIAACYLLDARKPEKDEIFLFIAVTVDDEAAHMDSVAQQFQTMLRQFPIQAQKTYIMSSARFIKRHAGTEFYSREAVAHISR